MQEKVQEFLLSQEQQQDINDEIYHYSVLQYAELLTDQYGNVPVTEQDYLNTPEAERKIENGKFLARKRLPIEVTDEEFTAVEGAISKDVIAYLKHRTYDTIVVDTDQKSNAATFFTVLAWILWIGGLIIAIVGSNVTVQKGGYYSYTTTEFSFALFMSTFVIYLISGAFCLCAAELFKKLQTIVNLLRRKQ